MTDSHEPRTEAAIALNIAAHELMPGMRHDFGLFALRLLEDRGWALIRAAEARSTVETTFASHRGHSLAWDNLRDGIVCDVDGSQLVGLDTLVAFATPTTTADLDVERLARAMHEQHPDQQSLDDAACRVADAHEASDLAERYARLATTQGAQK